MSAGVSVRDGHAHGSISSAWTAPNSKIINPFLNKKEVKLTHNLTPDVLIWVKVKNIHRWNNESNWARNVCEMILFIGGPVDWVWGSSQKQNSKKMHLVFLFVFIWATDTEISVENGVWGPVEWVGDQFTGWWGSYQKLNLKKLHLIFWISFFERLIPVKKQCFGTSWMAAGSDYALFLFIFSLRQTRFGSDFTQISEQKNTTKVTGRYIADEGRGCVLLWINFLTPLSDGQRQWLPPPHAHCHRISKILCWNGLHARSLGRCGVWRRR